MGIIHKLKPEIKDFILSEKKVNSELSCRTLSSLVYDKFQIRVSKSSINSLFKTTGLSMPVGRRPKKRRRKLEPPPPPIVEAKPEMPVEAPPVIPAEPVIPPEPVIPAEPEVVLHVETPSEIESNGAILLKAADCLIGGSLSITEAVKNRLNKQDSDLTAKTEALVYLPLWEPDAQNKDLSQLWALIDKQLSLEVVLSYLDVLQGVKTISLDIMRIIPNILQEARYIKINLSGTEVVYLDGQMHTLWSTPHIPYDFSSTIYNIKGYINKHFSESAPFILFMAPGYDSSTKEFFSFISGLDSRDGGISRLTLYNDKFEELEAIHLEPGKRRFFIFGLWPWQFVEFRKVKKIEDFKPFYFEGLKKEFYVAEIEIELSQPIAEQVVTLRGAALKTNPAEKTRLVMLSNLSSEAATPGQLANIYLSHWPNLEESFQDYSRKIERFTYAGSSQRSFSTESLDLNKDATAEIKTLLRNYLKTLDLYVRCHFLPPGYETKDFSTMKGQFYDLKAILKREKGCVSATFLAPTGFAFQKELEYALRRLNEREITFVDGKRLWFVV